MQLVAPHFFHPLSSLQRNFMYTLIQPQNCRIGNVFGLLRHGKNGCMIVIVPGFGDGIRILTQESFLLPGKSH